MISEAALNHEALILTPAQRMNFQRLFYAANEIERRFLADGGHALHVNRGVSTSAEQAKIDPQHPDSAHVKAAAVDFADWDHIFYKWCVANLDVLEELELWMESNVSAHAHVHLQIYPPRSGHRVFAA